MQKDGRGRRGGKTLTWASQVKLAFTLLNGPVNNRSNNAPISKIVWVLLLDYAAAQLRQYHRLTKQIKPDMETYERLREKQ